MKKLLAAVLGSALIFSALTGAASAAEVNAHQPSDTQAVIDWPAADQFITLKAGESYVVKDAILKSLFDYASNHDVVNARLQWDSGANRFDSVVKAAVPGESDVYVLLGASGNFQKKTYHFTVNP